MKLRDILENIIIVAIILVIVQTFLHELAVYLHWSVPTKNILVFTGLFFDLLFSVEFLVRSIISGDKKRLFRYWFYERGWVDFLSSLPLLLLDSGPSVFLLLTGNLHADSAIGILNVLKVVKAVRVTRILRLVRIIKIFGKIHNADSKMAQHHTATIATTAVFSIIFTLMVFSIFLDHFVYNEIKVRKAHYTNIFESLRGIEGRGVKPGLVKKIFRNDKKIIGVTYRTKHIISHFSEDDFRMYYGAEDYISLPYKKYTALISIVDIHKDIALNHLESFFIIIIVVISFMLFYTRHFAQTVGDLIHIMNKGFRKKSYNLEVTIREEYADQEIFSLARFYNDAYLPAKLKRIHEQEEAGDASGLSMDDIKGFKG